MSNTDPNLRSLQRLANTIVFAGVVSLLGLAVLGVVTLFRLAF